MWSIHPNQITHIVRSLSPADNEIALAAQILLAAKHAQWGPIQHEGILHDRASYRYYWSILQRAQVSGSALPSIVSDWFASHAPLTTTRQH